MSDLGTLRAQILENAFYLFPDIPSIHIILSLSAECKPPTMARLGHNFRFVPLSAGYYADVVANRRVLMRGSAGVGLEEAYLGLLDLLAIEVMRRCPRPVPTPRPTAVPPMPSNGVPSEQAWPQQQHPALSGVGLSESDFYSVMPGTFDQDTFEPGAF